MKKFKVSHKEFCEIFTKRKFTIAQKISGSIYFVEREDSYYIEEQNSISMKVIVTVSLPLAIIAVFIIGGLRGVYRMLVDLPSVYTDRYKRKDECHHRHESTDKLIDLAGWNI
jgi:hypothetical protein